MKIKIPTSIKAYLKQITLPAPDSHKGQNGKLLIVGGSELFHAASKWSLDVASKFVDMVFYASVPSNNKLVSQALSQAKAHFWNGIVIHPDQIEEYLVEADAVLIGPGMDRSSKTAMLVNNLLNKYPEKKWVIDAGALQMVESRLLNEHHLLTPHHQELKILQQKLNLAVSDTGENLKKTSQLLGDATLLLKGSIDQVITSEKIIEIPGGNAGMTKGGTGDVLAGLGAALYCQHSPIVAAVVSSFVNKKAGEYLFKQVGPFYNASDLVATVPKVMWELL